MWLRYLREHPDRIGDIAKVWSQGLKNVGKPDCRWNQVRSPMTALQAMLLDHDWLPIRMELWRDPEGCLWQLDIKHSRAFLVEFRLSLEAASWREAAKHIDSSGCEKGVF